MTHTDELLKKYLQELSDETGGKSIVDKILKTGKQHQSQELTPEERMLLQKRITSLNCPFGKDSFVNSSKLAMSDSKERFKYYEGFAYIDGYDIAFPHAWNELNGKLIDTTMTDRDENRIFGTFKKVSYFGIEVPLSQIRSLLGKSALFPFMKTQ